jgi:hypothetical protein
MIRIRAISITKVQYPLFKRKISISHLSLNSISLLKINIFVIAVSYRSIIRIEIQH